MIKLLKDLGFKDIKEIGMGGQAYIFRAIDPILEKPVAIKMLKNMVSLIEERRFIKENEILCRLKKEQWSNSPSYIRTIVDHSDGGRTIGIVMELIQGIAYKDLFSTPVERSDVTSRLLYFTKSVDLFRILYDKHKVIHRDINMGNVMYDEVNNRTIILDFGVGIDPKKGNDDSKSIELVTSPLRLMGQPKQTAPELYNGIQSNMGSEIFALGVMLYRIMSGGHSPFQREDDLQKHIFNIEKGNIIPLTNKKDKDANRYLKKIEAVVRKCVKFNPHQRYSNYADLLSELQNLTMQVNDIIAPKVKKKWWKK